MDTSGHFHMFCRWRLPANSRPQEIGIACSFSVTRSSFSAIFCSSKGTLWWRANSLAHLLIIVKAYPRILRELLFFTSTIGAPFVDAVP